MLRNYIDVLYIQTNMSLASPQQTCFIDFSSYTGRHLLRFYPEVFLALDFIPFNPVHEWEFNEIIISSGNQFVFEQLLHFQNYEIPLVPAHIH